MPVPYYEFISPLSLQLRCSAERVEIRQISFQVTLLPLVGSLRHVHTALSFNAGLGLLSANTKYSANVLYQVHICFRVSGVTGLSRYSNMTTMPVSNQKHSIISSHYRNILPATMKSSISSLSNETVVQCVLCVWLICCYLVIFSPVWLVGLYRAIWQVLHNIYCTPYELYAFHQHYVA